MPIITFIISSCIVAISSTTLTGRNKCISKKPCQRTCYSKINKAPLPIKVAVHCTCMMISIIFAMQTQSKSAFTLFQKAILSKWIQKLVHVYVCRAVVKVSKILQCNMYNTYKIYMYILYVYMYTFFCVGGWNVLPILDVHSLY